MNVYNEYQSIGPSLRSILPYVDGVILVDGAYPEFPLPDDVSSDGTVEAARYIVKQEWNKEFTVITPNQRRTEVEKRSTYLQYIQRNMDWMHTWAYVWDADMFMLGEPTEDFKLLRETSDALLAVCPAKLGDEPVLSNMIIGYRNIPDLHYAHTHFGLYDKQNVSVNLSYGKEIVMRHSLIHHDRSLRPTSRIQAQTDYYINTRLKYEI